MTYHNRRLPEEVERGSKFGPRFNTTVLEMASGSEQRNQNWQRMRLLGDVSYGIDNRDAFEAVVDHFYGRRGRAHTFPFKDWSDFELIDELIGVGDSTNDDFQIVKTYEDDGPLPYVRTITRPVLATLVVKVDGVTKTLTTHYTVTAKGLITFTGGNIPGTGAEVTVTCEFDVPCRYDSDEITIEMEQVDAGSIDSLPIIEDRDA